MLLQLVILYIDNTLLPRPPPSSPPPPTHTSKSIFLLAVVLLTCSQPRSKYIRWKIYRNKQFMSFTFGTALSSVKQSRSSSSFLPGMCIIPLSSISLFSLLHTQPTQLLSGLSHCPLLSTVLVFSSPSFYLIIAPNEREVMLAIWIFQRETIKCIDI